MAKPTINKMLEFIGVQKDEPEYEEDFFSEEEDEGDISPYASRREKAKQQPPRRAQAGFSEPDQSNEQTRRRARLAAIQGGASKTMIIHSPASYNDSQNLVIQLKQQKQVIIKLDALEKETAQRILDFMSGAAFAIEAQVTKISKGIYLFTSMDTLIQTAEAPAGEAREEAREGFFTLEDSFDRRR